MDLWLIFMIVLIVVVIVLFILLKYLARDPHRKISTYDNVVSPSDGRIIEIIPYDHTSPVVIEKTISKVIAHAESIGKKGHMITIYTKWNDIHHNRMPIAGTIHSFKKIEGKRFSPKDPEAILSNPRVEMVIVGKIKVKLVQIAGGLLSNVKTFTYPGKTLTKGQKIGNISFASQTVLILPGDVEIKIKEGRVVKAGETVIAEKHIPKKKESLRG